MGRIAPLRLISIACLAEVVSCCGCGGHSNPTPQPDFTLSASVSAVDLTAGGAPQSVSLTAGAVNGFSASIAITISGLPAGVTSSPSSLTLSPGSSAQVSFSVAATASAATSSVEFQAVSGALSHDISSPMVVHSAAVLGMDVLTYHYDVGRTGLNDSESTLTPSSVSSSSFGLMRMLPVDGKVDGQPLYISRLSIGAQIYSTVFAVTEHDSVYAFDADSGRQLWKSSILAGNESTSDDHGCNQITPEIGITSTPDIDRHAGPHGTIFVVGMSLDQSGAYHQRLHALDLATGAELPGSPVEIRAAYPGSGANSSGGSVIFDPGQYAERAGLLLLNGTLYLGFTSHCDQGPYTGWLMAYSESTLKQTGVLNLTPNGSEGSIWMSGAGLAADSSGYIYFLDANGTFDARLDASGFPALGDYGNAFLKVSTTGPALSVSDYFEPYDTVALSNADQDLGSGGVLVVPDLQDGSGKTRHLAVGAGKDRKIYLVDRDSMGKFNSANNNAIYQEIDGAIGGVWSVPAYFNRTIYYGAVDDAVKAFPLTAARLPASPSAQTANTFTYPGTTPSVSATGAANGVVWAVENTSPAVLHAYDAITLQELYNSNQAPNSRDHFGSGNKFITPVVADGRVFVGTPSAVAEFGLFK